MQITLNKKLKPFAIKNTRYKVAYGDFMNPRVSIIILNWNGWKDTMECLESLYKINYPNYDIIVIDNDSKDESIEKIKEYCNGKIEVNLFYRTKERELAIKKVFEERFKDDIKEIHNLIDSINKNRKIMLRELKYFEAKRIYDGDCEFIKYP